MGDHDPLVAELRRTCRGAVRAQSDLASLTTLRVGGPARVLVEAADPDDLISVGRACRRHGAPWLVVGRGSNLLVPDAGWPGVAVTLGRAFRGVSIDGQDVRAGAAEPLPALAVRTGRAGLTGFAWAVAVPGTLGGAVRMNAGAHGRDMDSVLVDAEVVHLATGTARTWSRSELGLTYRHSDLPGDAVVTAARLRLEPGSPDRIAQEMDAIREWRRAHQPLHQPNCGSVFANPPGDSAGRLIDTAGGKGLRIGHARISQRHANFIVTETGASARDVRVLIGRVADLVERVHGVRLRPEVVILDDGQPER